MPPVGLQGELRMTTRVRGPIAASSGSARMVKRVGAVGRHLDHGGAREAHLLGEAHPARRGQDDLVALFEERQRDLEERPLAARP